MVDKTKYVVLDVETNGLSSKRDDLLSISIFMPDKDVYLDRFLPLELQNCVLTTEINGITDKMLKGKSPLTQEEFDQIVIDFELDKRTILTYGKLDKLFIKEYTSRHKIKGFDKLLFKNIKDDIISTAYTNGLLTKDNICRALGIEGVTDIHSGHNDCFLEWKLFEYMNGKKLFVAYNYEFCPSNIKHNHENWYIYEFSKDYILPVSYLHSHPKIIKVLQLPTFELQTTEVYKHSFSKKCSPEYAFQPAGIASEHLIKTMLDARRIDSIKFLTENKKKLKFLGYIEAPEIETILYEENDDGTLIAVNKKDQKYIDAMNRQTIEIKKEIGPLINFIKDEIFGGKEILTQELIVNTDYNLLGLCDFSNDQACLEAKWRYNPINKRDYDEFKYQLFITSNGRPCYIMSGSGDEILISRVDFIQK